MNASEELPEWDPRRLGIVRLPSGQELLDVDGIYGFLIPTEVPFILGLAQSLPEGGKYLEIGSFMGLSAVIAAGGLIGKGNLDARVFCVDTWQGSIEHQGLDFIRKGELFEIFKYNITRARVSEWITPCRGKSVDVASEFKDNSLDLIFIDGDHTYDGCLADIEAWLPKLKKGGRLLGHDAIPVENPSCGVRRAVEYFTKREGFQYKIYPPPTAHYAWEMIF